MIVSCKLDNYEQPNAQVTGRILDAVTGDLVGTDYSSGNAIGLYEQGWPTEARQTWTVKNTGEYTNNLVWAATYRIEFINCNFYPFLDTITLTKGANTVDFTVTPYLRIKTPSITYDDATKKVTATFYLEKGGTGATTLKEYRLFAFTDMWVGNYIKLAITTTDCYKTFSGTGTALAATQYTLTMDIAANSSLFKYTQNYYFRIGALAVITPATVGTIRHNFSPLVKINIPR
jgi:hypothetical protein